jgi:two-component system cell cycle sensor histidine kinase/response regulator CckA
MDKNKNPDQYDDLQKQTEDKTQKSENLYLVLFTQMTDGCTLNEIICDADGKPIDYITLDINPAFEFLLGVQREDVIGKKASEILSHEELAHWLGIFGPVALTGSSCSYEMYSPSNKKYFEGNASCPEIGKFAVVFSDVTDRKMMDEEKEITIKLLLLLDADNNLHEFMKEVTNLLHEWSGCEAVGIRLHDGDDYPYFETRGFPPEFIEANRLCAVDQSGELVRDSEGNPVLECMCGNVIRGRFNPELPFFTEGGSFWSSNCTTELLASTSEGDRQARTRNRCNGEGYESVALVPIRSIEGCLGLLQFNDRQKGRFTKERIEFFERLASSLAIAISQRKAVKELKDTTQILDTIFNATHVQVAYLDPQFNFIMVNRAYADIAEKDIKFFTGKNNFDLFPDPDTKVVFLRVVETGQPYFAYAIPYEYPNNPERSVTYWDWSLVPIKDNEGVVTSLVFALENVTERMLIEEQLRENQERYRIITDNMRDTLWLMDLSLRTTWISPSVTRTRGFTLEELQEMPLDKQLTSESLNRAIKTYQENMDPDKLLNLEVDVTVSGEFEYYRKDGSTFWADTVITLLRGINGEPTGFMWVGRDITEHKQAEEKLRENEERYRNVIAQAGGVAYQRDWQNETYTFMDEGIKHLTGYSSSEMTPGLFERLFDEGNTDGTNKKFIRSKISQQIGENAATVYRGGFCIRTKDGQIKFVSDSSIELRNENGELIQTLGMLQDITQIKLSEEQLRDSEAKYRTLFNSLADTIFIHDFEGHFLEVNEVAVEQLGYNHEELLRMSLMDIDSPDYAKLVPERMETIIETGYAFFESEHITKDGIKIPIEVNARIIEYNRMPAVIGVSRDITERKQAEAELLNSRILLQASIESPTGIIIMSIGTNYQYLCFNTTHKEAMKFAYNKDVEIGMNVLDCITSDIDRQKAKDNYDRAMAGESHSTIEVYGSDNKSYYESFYNPIFDAQKEIIGITAYAMNITERKKAESLLRENEEKYRALVESLPDIIMRFDQNARHIYVSDSVTKDTGVLPSEFIGKTHKELGFPDEISEYWEQSISRVFGTGKIVEDEFEFDGINGHIIYNWRLVPEINESGNVASVLGIARDITEHRKSEKSYHDMFSGMINGFALNEIIYDESGKPINYRFIDVNPAFEKLIGLSSDWVVGNTILDVMPETESYWIDICDGVALTGEPIHSEEYIKGLGKYFEVTVYSPQKGQFATIFSDITDRKQFEELQTRLQQTTKLESIGRLAGGVAHDFNNMLTVIQGSTSLAMMDLNRSDPLYNRLKMIEEASDRATGLTRQLLAFSRKQIIELKIINLNDIITNLQKMLGRLIGEDIELQTFLHENPIYINADTVQIEQIIINLAVNSRDAMPDGGKLTIETSRVFLDENYCRMHPNAQVGNYVQMTITDNGYGMSEDTKEHIFEPFFTTKKLGEGTGLGLATVYGIVKQHNGSIECYSELEHGTIFKVYLPEDVERKVSELEESEKTDIVTGSETVLLVEDDNFVREMTTDFLKYLGYNVLIAENGGMAFIIAEQYNQTIHLLLTDIVMPGINGRQLAERLLKIHPEMNVLYTSGYTQNIIAHHGVLEEGLNFIGKPFRLQELADKIRDVLSQKQ